MQYRFPAAHAEPEPRAIFWPNAVIQTVGYAALLVMHGRIGIFYIALIGLASALPIATQAIFTDPVYQGHVAKSDFALRLGLILAAVAAAVHVAEVIFDLGRHLHESLWIGAAISSIATSLIVFRALKPFSKAPNDIPA